MVMLLEDIVESVELWLKLIRKKPQPYVDPDLDPVLLVPGIAGSILKAVDNKGREDRVWVRILSADYKCRTKLWSLFDPSIGKTVSLDPKSNISVPEGRDGLYAIDILDPDLVFVVSYICFSHVGCFYLRSAPGYVTSTFVNGMSFVEGWEQNFFISKWSMHQLLLECPSFYELMACPHFCWENSPLLQIWKQNCDSDGNSNILLESYSPEESISIFTEALSTNMVKYDGVDISLPFNLGILKWANETRKVYSSAKLPPQVKFYNVYGTNLETPHSVCYGSEGAPVTDLQQLPSLMANYVCVDGDGTGQFL
ncbi:lecithin-cholesterol acyltransferase-like 4 [Rhododendron vialii]|uniref:lecithin-cholesterol acyltransferase-like 4 n=1 Tax=Rhododendron vialii TaxID=182163 RepID=UPI00265F9DD5|nr:lecithin-cholesterol acyltransferase-like 4 [Rhododendron vialii]